MLDALKKVENIDSLSKATKAKLAVFYNMIEGFRKNISMQVSQIIENVFNESGLEQSIRAVGSDGQSALENVGELINAASKYDKKTEDSSLLDYIQQISLFSDADAYDTSSECVALMTLHAAKGLEFENVFIVGLEEGLLPHERANYSDDEDELEEERRLFFVGVTRAKSGLNISYARYRTVRGQMLRTIPSQFLFELGSHFNQQAQEIDSHDESYDDIPEFVSGQLVRHNSFGLGRIKEFIDMGANSVVVVQFNTGQTKTLMLKYANLTNIDL
jgi:DNA helicase-2/ATP-dependent DNA helicase PcrA